ncbi:MAG: dihydropteroate synthase [Rikenellaceae bacterium]
MKQDKINIDFSKPQVMAILNITPDSFYKESRTFTPYEIEKRVAQIVAEGATIIDIGGYSSRPGADEVSLEEEVRRVERGLEIVRRIAPDMAVSIDTFRAPVAKLAIVRFGALIINDISAGELDPELMNIAAKYKVPYIAMHMRGTPKTMQQQTGYVDVVGDVVDFFRGKVEQLRSLGVDDIILDPGFGFAKDVEQNYELLANTHRLKEFGVPILVGVSRKSMIYKVLEKSPSEALTGTIALNWEALRQGATIIRVHDVSEAAETVKIYNKFLRQ